MELTYPHPICDARNFLDAFKRACQSEPSPWRQYGSSNYKEWTAWFGRMMDRIAKDAGSLHCQNKCSTRPGEWLAVDHIIMTHNSYACFPLVVAEHENYGLGTVDGTLPDALSLKARIEWAFWKAIAVRSFLSVLVAYPEKVVDKDNFDQPAIKVLEEIATGWRTQFGQSPNCLCLLGWWASGNRPVNEVDLYDAYISVAKDNRIEFVQLS